MFAVKIPTMGFLLARQILLTEQSPSWQSHKSRVQLPGWRVTMHLHAWQYVYMYRCGKTVAHALLLRLSHPAMGEIQGVY